ncbi:MAG: hypothetical protein IT366_08930 [Candidatus Hydrogenedentes bacterium]|nr:hypothetical protein [Candidatus Hydrogenedentota bacterium]
MRFEFLRFSIGTLGLAAMLAMLNLHEPVLAHPKAANKIKDPSFENGSNK